MLPFIALFELKKKNNINVRMSRKKRKRFYFLPLSSFSLSFIHSNLGPDWFGLKKLLLAPLLPLKKDDWARENSFSPLRFLPLTILWGFVNQHCAECRRKVLVEAAALDLATGVFHFTVAYFGLLCFDCVTLRNLNLAKFRSNSEFGNTVKPDVCFLELHI